MKFPFKVSLIAVCFSMILVMAVAVLFGLWVSGNQAAEDISNNLFDAVSSNVRNETLSVLESTRRIAVVAAGLENEGPVEGLMPDHILKIYKDFLDQNETLYSLYRGFNDGRFGMVIATRNNPSIMARESAPPGTVYVESVIMPGEGAEGGPLRYRRYFDSAREEIGRATFEDTYDPRQRPWYQATYGGGVATLSPVYMFSSLMQPGITAAYPTPEGQGVVGVDLTLFGLTEFMMAQEFAEYGRILLTDKNDHVVAFSQSSLVLEDLITVSELGDPLMQSAFQNWDRSQSTVSVDNRDYMMDLTTFQSVGQSFNLYMLAEAQEFKGPFIKLQRDLLLQTIGVLVFFIPIIILFSNQMVKNLTNLVSMTHRIGNQDFRPVNLPNTRIHEVQELQSGFDGMRSSLDVTTKDLLATQLKLNRLVELGIAMSAEQDSDHVMGMLLDGAMEIAQSDVVALYTLDETVLKLSMVRCVSLGLSINKNAYEEIGLSPIHTVDEQGNFIENSPVTAVVNGKQAINLENVYAEADSHPFATQFDTQYGYTSRSVLVVPLAPRGGDVIGVLHLVNAQTLTGEPDSFDDDIQRFVEALAAQAATVLYNRSLLSQQETLMDSFIQIIADAIDTKSPYTGGHCARVPELAMMLVKEASDRKTGPFADFSFETKKEWREFTIGAYLHDCGKVVTPEYVVDKATKLETIYNRIHEVRTRFEVLLRDANITYYQGLLDGGDEATLAAALEARKAKLIDDFAFIAECNIGGEFMEDEKIARLEEIAQEVWTRHFDMRLGLSHEEERLYANAPAAPVQETLLSDQPWHILPRTRDVMQQYKDLNFKVDVPEHQYNRGEVYNLSVKRGTLEIDRR